MKIQNRIPCFISVLSTCLFCICSVYAEADPSAETDRGESVWLRHGSLRGQIHDNVSNAKRQGSGFNPLIVALFPDRNLFRDEFVGLNFEHIFNGMVADREISMFTPRKDPNHLRVHSRKSASLLWHAAESSWAMDCELKYTLASSNAVDLSFSATPREDRFGLGYAALMWASYMNCTRERKIHFYGVDGVSTGWLSFGDDTPDGFETGTVAYAGVHDLPYEEGAQSLNIIEHPRKRFLMPFYYGLVDGDGDPETKDDTLAYIMMFDRRTSIRFAMWNFIRDDDKNPDPHSPAWDWQFVIRKPEPGRTYGYNARLLIKPFVSAEDVRQEYLKWSAVQNAD